NKPATRRGILSVVSSVYDPLGFLAPALLPAKLILRDLCKEKCGWDEEVEVKHIQKWKKWMDDLKLLTDYKVNRCFKPTGFGTIKTAQMHHFADASEDGYGTVTYLVLTNEEGKRHCSFLMGKSRVAPLKQVTIPRMELTAAVVAVKMDKMLKGELQMPLQESTFWTDSTTVLKYISNESTRFKTFVANRISVIRDHSQPSQWRYVTSVLNPLIKLKRAEEEAALKELYNMIKEHENTYPDSVVIILGDFNHCNLRKNMHQFMTFPNRGNKTLDHYGNVRNAFSAEPKPHFGKSNHLAIRLNPVYNKRLKTKPVIVRTI
ncbi:uncharacterized protein LOC120528756, partial [Polypterus senegalus]|uniref:uncharacterized protein LOC120528756 n=1 Tax=Polypterus senegalus TaxID=55291 RepID=UPI0019640685